MQRKPPAYAAGGEKKRMQECALPPLVEVAALLTRELSLAEGPVTEVIPSACRSLGVGAECEGLVPKASACYLALYGPQGHQKPQLHDPVVSAPAEVTKYLGPHDFNAEGTFALRSVSSSNYLDGRNPGHLGNEVHMTQRPPQNDKYLHWKFENMGNNTWAIRSVSSNNYLDGRNPEHVGDELFLTRRPPVGDRYLHWKLESHGQYVTLRSVSSGNCIDGRNPNHVGGHMVFMTSTRQGRNPATDKYLQWVLEPM
mmetsp:Transcript_121513/g.170955  ORF Transcript_121513/g.170955 Transcript_121513/m.170955 type:complete len:255 (-) Transcript_121513:32-796(-)